MLYNPRSKNERGLYGNTLSINELAARDLARCIFAAENITVTNMIKAHFGPLDPGHRALVASVSPLKAQFRSPDPGYRALVAHCHDSATCHPAKTAPNAVCLVVATRETAETGKNAGCGVVIAAPWSAKGSVWAVFVPLAGHFGLGLEKRSDDAPCRAPAAKEGGTVRTRLEPADAGRGLGPLANIYVTPCRQRRLPPRGAGVACSAHRHKQRMELSQMAKLHSCGADEARTRDPRRDRPVF